MSAYVYNDWDLLTSSEKEAEELDSDPCYYKIIFGRRDKYTVACLQSFDEGDYDQDRFLTDKDGHQYKFFKEENAKAFLNRVIDSQFIDDEYLIVNNEHMYKIPKEEW